MCEDCKKLINLLITKGILNRWEVEQKLEMVTYLHEIEKIKSK